MEKTNDYVVRSGNEQTFFKAGTPDASYVHPGVHSDELPRRSGGRVAEFPAQHLSGAAQRSLSAPATMGGYMSGAAVGPLRESQVDGRAGHRPRKAVHFAKGSLSRGKCSLRVENLPEKMK